MENTRSIYLGVAFSTEEGTCHYWSAVCTTRIVSTLLSRPLSRPNLGHGSTAAAAQCFGGRPGTWPIAQPNSDR